MQFFTLAENALMLQLGDKVNTALHQKLRHIQKSIDRLQNPTIIETVIGYTTLVIYFDPFQTSHREIKRILSHCIDQTSSMINSQPSTIHQIPVCYEDSFSPDLSYVATTNGLTKQDVIKRHTDNTYLVHFIGFSPGFPFLGGMDLSIATPRKTRPRMNIPKGAIGIAGGQTGIYPSSSPGGWQIIGRTPIELVDLSNEQPTLLRAGDQLRFYAISKQQYLEWSGGKRSK